MPNTGWFLSAACFVSLFGAFGGPCVLRYLRAEIAAETEGETKAWVPEYKRALETGVRHSPAEATRPEGVLPRESPAAVQLDVTDSPAVFHRRSGRDVDFTGADYHHWPVLGSGRDQEDTDQEPLAMSELLERYDRATRGSQPQ